MKTGSQGIPNDGSSGIRVEKKITGKMDEDRAPEGIQYDVPKAAWPRDGSEVRIAQKSGGSSEGAGAKIGAPMLEWAPAKPLDHCLQTERKRSWSIY